MNRNAIRERGRADGRRLVLIAKISGEEFVAERYWVGVPMIFRSC